MLWKWMARGIMASGVLVILVAAFELVNYYCRWMEFGVMPIASVILGLIGYWLCRQAAKM